MNNAFDFDENELEKLLPPNFDIIAKQAFIRYDTDKNGAIDVNELYNILDQVGKELCYDDNVTLDDAKEGMTALDLNKNNVLEYAEFRKLFAALFIIKKSQG